MSRTWPVALLLVAGLGMSGCAVLLVGAGAAGGYAISKDSVKNVFDLSKEYVYDHSLAAVQEMGVVKSDDRRHGLITAEVQSANITITVRPLTKETVELKVKGRNAILMPKVDVAQEVYTNIIERF